MKRIEYEAEVLERHDTEQGLRVAGFAEDDWCVPLALREREMALGDRPRNRCPVRERELLVATGRETDASPDGVGQQRIHRAGINEELDAFSARRPADGSFDVADAHLPGYGLPIIAPSTSLELSPRLAILPAPGGLLGPHDVLKAGRQQLITVDRETRGVACEVVVALRSGGSERDIEAPRVVIKFHISRV